MAESTDNMVAAVDESIVPNNLGPAKSPTESKESERNGEPAMMISTG